MSDDKDEAPFAVGDVVAGKYRVERVLGEGGMGTVVAATHLELDELRALKFVLPSMSENQEVVGRFLREARAVAKIDSEHVAKIHDIGRLDDGAPYLVMEHLEGEDLKALLAREGPLEVEVAVRFALQALVGLADAHARKIIHRDLKPPNLFIAEASDGVPRIKVLDFGVSKLVGHDVPELDKTRTNVMLGSPYYMSPEQMESTKDVDARSDIWSMGVVLYEMLAGEVPFDGPSITALTIKVVQQDPAPLGSFRDDLPEGLDAVVMRCLEKKPENRYPTVAALAEALEPFAEAGDLAARAARILSRAEPGERATQSEREEAAPEPGRSSSPTRVVTGSRKSSTPRKSSAPRKKKKKKQAAHAKPEGKRLDGARTASSWAAPGSEPHPGRRYLLIGAALGAIAATVALVASRGDDAPDATVPATPSAAVEATALGASAEPIDATEPAIAEPSVEPADLSAEPSADPSADASADASADPSVDPTASAAPAGPRPRPRPRRDDIYRGVDDDPYADYEKQQRRKAPATPFD